MSETSYSFLTVGDVIELHQLQLDAYGGAEGIRSRELLESAVMSCQASFDGNYVHRGVFEIAAAYAFHIAQNQPFVDGNKRAALVAALVFLDWHDVEIDDPEEKLHDIMISIANRSATKSDLASLFAELSDQAGKP